MNDDDFVDLLFGEWIVLCRRNMKYSVASQMTGISIKRIQELECGAPKKGVTRKECLGFAKGYKQSISVVIKMAIGKYDVR